MGNRVQPQLPESNSVRRPGPAIPRRRIVDGLNGEKPLPGDNNLATSLEPSLQTTDVPRWMSMVSQRRVLREACPW
jgi:hypothetical protein